MTHRPVVISGLGVVSAIGNTVEEFWESCLAGRTVIEQVPSEWGSYYESKSRLWSPLKLPDYAAYGLNRADTLRNDRVVLNAIVAADDALQQARIEKQLGDGRDRSYRLPGVDSDRVGVFIGTGLGCISSAFNNYVPHLLAKSSVALFSSHESLGDTNATSELKLNYSENSRVNPFASCQSMANAIGASLSIRYRSRGATETLVSACAAGTTAIARAFRAIQHGEIDVAIAGGSEYYGDRAGGVFMAFDRLRTLVHATETNSAVNCPFDDRRSGFLFSQGGAGIVVLESQEHARNRGASPIANIIGMGITSDAHSLAAMSESNNAIDLMFTKLFSDAGVPAGEIGYVNSHGTSTLLNDSIESKILARLFSNSPLVNSTKSLLGHTIGASGAIECIVTALSLKNRKVHASLNLRNPVTDLNFATDVTPIDTEFAVTHNFGFGGHNAGLLLQRTEI